MASVVTDPVLVLVSCTVADVGLIAVAALMGMLLGLGLAGLVLSR